MIEGRKIPATISTQHPDNANLPPWCTGSVIEGNAEIHEVYFAFHDLGCQEVMWDSEGKDVDTRVVRKLLSNYPEYFSANQLGRDVFLTYRIPNPKIEGAERKVVVETLQNMTVACDVASSFYKREVSPIFEVMLPFTTDAKDLLWLHNYYKKAIAEAEEIRLDEEITVREWIGCFQPKAIEIIPIVEDYDSIFTVDRILDPFIISVKPRYMRVFIARSDPALNYGLLCAVLLAKVALSKLYSLAQRRGISIHPIIGVGSMPFRGHLSPTNVEKFLEEYKGLSTVTIQSALKYDYPLEEVKTCVSTLNRCLPNSIPQTIDHDEEEALDSTLQKSATLYGKIVERLAPLINNVSSYVPPRRARRLHIGLFGYSRRVGTVTLPRAIPFAAALYSLGIPPELLGGRIFSELKESEWEIVSRHYINLRHDLEVAGGFLSWRNIELLRHESKRVAKRAGMDEECLKEVIKDILGDLESIERTLGIKLGPTNHLQMKHENFANNFLISYLEGDHVAASTSLLEAAKTRRCLG
ncbi:MAG: phosphoenolpyruvate carboxylase [Candidatus Methanomethyliales bacterium]|nr:phosphoenolpyruvate carboxylase [Candidatus Methanomethylicales archaeon]